MFKKKNEKWYIQRCVKYRDALKKYNMFRGDESTKAFETILDKQLSDRSYIFQLFAIKRTIPEETYKKGHKSISERIKTYVDMLDQYVETAEEDGNLRIVESNIPESFEPNLVYLAEQPTLKEEMEKATAKISNFENSK